MGIFVFRVWWSDGLPSFFLSVLWCPIDDTCSAREKGKGQALGVGPGWVERSLLTRADYRRSFRHVIALALSPSLSNPNSSPSGIQCPYCFFIDFDLGNLLQ